MAGEIDIKRQLDEIADGVKKIGDKSKSTNADLRDVNKNLRLDPTNTKLLAEKQKLLAEKLEQSKERTSALKSAMQELNEVQTENDTQLAYKNKLLDQYSEQQKQAERETIGLTGAIKNQTAVKDAGALSTKAFSKSMTELNSTIRLVNQSTRSMNQLFLLFGGDKDSRLGQVLSTIPKVVQVMTGMIATIRLLSTAMKLLSINTWSWKSALTFGAMGAVAVGTILAISKATQKANEEMADVGTGGIGVPNISVSSGSSPNVPQVAQPQSVRIDAINIYGVDDQNAVQKIEEAMNTYLTNRMLVNR